MRKRTKNEINLLSIFDINKFYEVVEDKKIQLQRQLDKRNLSDYSISEARKKIFSDSEYKKITNLLRLLFYGVAAGIIINIIFVPQTFPVLAVIFSALAIHTPIASEYLYSKKEIKEVQKKVEYLKEITDLYEEVKKEILEIEKEKQCELSKKVLDEKVENKNINYEEDLVNEQINYDKGLTRKLKL